MKPWRVILSIVLLLISITRFASTCSKNAERKKTNEFTNRKNLIERSRWEILRYDKNDPDSVEWMMLHARAFNSAIDSSVKYYTDNYGFDEPRYKKCLYSLYEYKKIAYLYQGWLKYKQKYIPSNSNAKEYEEKAKAFYRDLLYRMNELRRKEFDAVFDL